MRTFRRKRSFASHGTSHDRKGSRSLRRGIAIDVSTQQWTRLIRFIAVQTSRVHIGQPVDPNVDGTFRLAFADFLN